MMRRQDGKGIQPLPAGVKPPQFAIAVTLLTVLVFALTAWGTASPVSSSGLLVVLALQAVIFVNALIPHLVLAARHRAYNPGLWTALLVHIPFSAALFQRALGENLLTLETLLVMLGAAPVVMILLIKSSLWAAGWIQAWVMPPRHR